MERDPAGCGALLAAAVILDTFDGRFARWVRRRMAASGQPSEARSNGDEMGVQLDSLVDAVVFGLVPVACASVLFGLQGPWWWGVAFLYAACAVTRLASYNLSHEAAGFTGLPTPVAALCWSSLFLFDPGASGLFVVALTTAIAMVAPIRVPRPAGAGLLLFVLWPVSVALAHAARLVA